MIYLFIYYYHYRIILESDPMLITQRVQLRQDDIPLGEQTVSQVSFSISNKNKIFQK